jgi:hypothetical protein
MEHFRNFVKIATHQRHPILMRLHHRLIGLPVTCTNDRNTCSDVFNPSLYNRTSHVSWSPRRISSTYRSLRRTRSFSITVVVVGDPISQVHPQWPTKTIIIVPAVVVPHIDHDEWWWQAHGKDSVAVVVWL